MCVLGDIFDVVSEGELLSSAPEGSFHLVSMVTASSWIFRSGVYLVCVVERVCGLGHMHNGPMMVFVWPI